MEAAAAVPTTTPEAKIPPPPPGLGFSSQPRAVPARRRWITVGECKIFVADGSVMCRRPDGSAAAIPVPQKLAEAIDLDCNPELVVVLDSAGLLTVIEWTKKDGKPEFKVVQQEQTGLDQIHLCKKSNTLYGSAGKTLLAKFKDPKADLHAPETSEFQASYMVPDQSSRAIYTLAEDPADSPRIMICGNISAAVDQQIYIKLDPADPSPEDLRYISSTKSMLIVSGAGAILASLFTETKAKFPLGPSPKLSKGEGEVVGCIAGKAVYLIEAAKELRVRRLGEILEAKAEAEIDMELVEGGKTARILVHSLEAASQSYEFPVPEGVEPEGKKPVEEKKEVLPPPGLLAPPDTAQPAPVALPQAPEPEKTVELPPPQEKPSAPVAVEEKKAAPADMPEILKMLSEDRKEPAHEEENKKAESPKEKPRTETVGTQTDEGFKARMLAELEKKFESVLFSRLEMLKAKIAAEVEVKVEQRVAGIVGASVDRHMNVVKDSIDRNLQKCVAKSVNPERLQDQINAVHERLQANLNFIMQKVFLPAFEDSCSKMVKEVTKTYHDGVAAQRQRLEADDASMKELKAREASATKRNLELAEQLESVAARQLGMIRKAEEVARIKLASLQESLLAQQKAPPQHVPAPAAPAEIRPREDQYSSVIVRPVKPAEEAKERPIIAQRTMPVVSQAALGSPAEEFEAALAAKDAMRAIDVSTLNCFKGNEFFKLLDSFDEATLSGIRPQMQPNHHAYIRYSINRVLSYLSEHKDKINARLVGLLKKGQTLLAPVQSAYQDYQAVQTMLGNFFRWVAYSAPAS